MPNESFRAIGLKGQDVTVVAASSRRTFARHSHDEFGIGLIHRGAQRSWSGRGDVEAEAGDIITVNAGEVHDGEPVGGSRSWTMLYIAPERMARIVSDICEGRDRAGEFSRPVVRDAQASTRFTAAYASLTSVAGQAAEERLMVLIAGLLADAAEPPPVGQPAIALAKARIDDDPAVAHPLAELARLTGASRFQTLRGFVRQTGLTPHAYMVQRRLDVARGMIRCGHALADVAAATGFADQSHFHRSFTRRYGLTPGTFAAAML
jgi:AraC-like DNA-binding protein